VGLGWLQKQRPKGHMFKKKVQSPCLEHDDHHGFNSAHDWVNLYDHLMTTRIIQFDVDLNKIFIVRKVAMALIWIC
jgi:hypothetical protein